MLGHFRLCVSKKLFKIRGKKWEIDTGWVFITLYFIVANMKRNVFCWGTQNVILYFKCTECLLVFSTKGNLTAHHLLLHTGQHKPCICPICKGHYTVKRNLVVHMRKHHFGGLDKTKGDNKIKRQIEELINKGIVLRAISCFFSAQLKNSWHSVFLTRFEC